MSLTVRSIAALMLVAVPLAAASARADEAADRAGISAGYAEQCSALKAGDVSRWAATIVRDYLPTFPNGKHGSYDETMKGIAQFLASTQVEACSVAIASVTRSGELATVRGVITQEGTTASKSIVIVQPVTDTWTDAGGRWRQKSTTVAEQIISIDGKVIRDDTAATDVPTPKPRS